MKEKTFSRSLFIFVIINMIYLLASVLISRRAVGDDLEHIHASWLVWQGLIPYTDFFEHHHPLMWFLFAPLVGLMSGNLSVFFVIRFIMCGVSIATLYVVYRLIKDFWGDKISAFLAVSIFCFSNTAMDAMVQFKPDGFMHLFFFSGLYCFFMFLHTDKQKYLNRAFVCWAVSFLFLQTVIFLLLPIVVYGIYLLLKNKKIWRNIAKASIYGFAPVFLFGIYLLCAGNLQRYFETNWLLNSKIMADIWETRIKDFSDLYSILLLGIVSAVYLICQKPNKYVGILLIMYAIEFLLRVTYISIWMYYFKILILYNAILIGLMIGRCYTNRKWLAWCVLPLMVIFCGKFWLFEGVNPNEIDTLKVLQIATTISQNSTQDDVVLGLPGIPFGVFNKNPHYYWFSWNYMGRLDEKNFHYSEPFDINKIIKEKKPKFIYYEDYKKKNPEKRKKYAINPQLLYQTYRSAVYDTLFVYENE